MASIIRLSVDAAVYEYSSIIWEELAGQTPESAVYCLSTGKGIIDKADDVVLNQLQEFLPRVDRFVPRVRLDCADANIYSTQCRTLIARWRRKLVNVRTALLRSGKVIYLTDAVNHILAKPYNDEIARFRSSIVSELAMVKEGKELTEEQQHKIEEVNQKIDEQRQKLRELPRCTNVILTSMLHEAIDDMPEGKRRELDNLVKMRNDCLNDQHTTNAKLNDVKAQLRNLRNDAPEEERNKLQGEVKELEKKLQNLAAQFEQYRQQRMGILQEYYDQLKPEVVAKSLKEAPASFWEFFNQKQTMLEVGVKMASVPKTIKSNEGDAKTETSKRKRKQPTQVERAVALMFFPYGIGSADASNFSTHLDHDSQLMDEYDEWTEKFTGKSITQEYRDKYAEFCREFQTIPESALASLAQEPPFVQLQRKVEQDQPQVSNYDRLISALNEKAGSDKTGLGIIEKNDSLLHTFSERQDFEEQFSKIELTLKNNTYVSAAFTKMREIVNNEQDINNTGSDV